MRFASIVTGLTLLTAPAAPHARPQADPRADVLTSVQWLKEHLADPKLVLLHVGPPDAYPAKHIPGARYIDMDAVSQPMDHNREPLPTERMLSMPSADSLRAHLESFGISSDSRIVVYVDQQWYSPSTRVLLAIDYAGLGRNATLLDGGMAAWIAAGNATTADSTPRAKRGTLPALKIQPVIVTGDWVKANVGKPGVAIIDGRAAGFYDGTQEGGPPGSHAYGHIPSAKSVPFNTVWADNKLLPAEKLREIFTAAGVKPGDTVVGYCHVGQQATAMLFAARSLGFKTVLYDGSFEDWARNAWPVENPAKKGS